ncbi:MAG TPA: penicillin-binding protein, partial [Sphingobium sp.]
MRDPLPVPPSDPAPAREFGAGPPSAFAPPTRWRRRLHIAGWVAAALLALLMVMIAWLAVTAPMSRSLKPIAPPSISLTSADGHLIARRGAIIDKP